MVRFILVTFAFLAWAFYEMSGGADFDPDRLRAERAQPDPLQAGEPSDAMAGSDTVANAEVTRAALDLTSVNDVLNGTDGTQQPNRPAQEAETGEPSTFKVSANQDAEVVPAVASSADTIESDTGTARVIPSLVQNATPEADIPAEQVDMQVDRSVGADIRVVTGSRVNVRSGPGTRYGVVSKVAEGDQVEILEDPGAGWVRMRPADGGTVGWMADFLLTEG